MRWPPAGGGGVFTDAELARTARCVKPSPGGRGRCTPRRRRPQRRGPLDDRAEGVIPSRRGWRPRPRRQLGRTPRAILAPVSDDAGRAASRGRGRHRGPRGHGSRSSSTLGRHPCRPRDATAVSEPRRRRRRGRCAPMQAPAPPGPCANPTMRARPQASQCADHIRFGGLRFGKQAVSGSHSGPDGTSAETQTSGSATPDLACRVRTGKAGLRSGRRAARPRRCSCFSTDIPPESARGCRAEASDR